MHILPKDNWSSLWVIGKQLFPVGWMFRYE
jgi:hypothetical protein